MGHLDHQAQPAQAGIVSRAHERYASQERRGDGLRLGCRRGDARRSIHDRAHGRGVGIHGGQHRVSRGQRGGGGVDEPGCGARRERDRAPDRAGALCDGGRAGGESYGASAGDFRRASGRDGRSDALHVERELLFQRSGVKGFRVESGAARDANRVRSDGEGGSWWDGLPVVQGEFSQSDVEGVDVRDAGREAGAISGGAAGVTVAFVGYWCRRLLVRLLPQHFAN